jgi:low temperature requirement protein LtrA
MQPRIRQNFSIWWGPPKQFSNPDLGRRVSWLELFYDVVYVIAIARITHHFAAHISFAGFVEYACLFILIYWGWLNGSLHHDVHGNQGLRTRLMTLWQMMILAALAIMIDKMHGDYRNVTILFMIFQVFITYLWESVGFYDKSHRRYSRPYTVLYLTSFALMGVTLFTPESWKAFLIPVILILNFSPPFITARLMKNSGIDLDLTQSMFERLGLFTIIVFGELVIGVVNGMSEVQALKAMDWVNFVLSIAIVFSLWWIFFTFISRREVRKGFFRATVLEILYIPCLVALGCIAATFSMVFTAQASNYPLICFAISVFILGIYSMIHLLEFHRVFDTILRTTKLSMVLLSLVFILLGIFIPDISTTAFLSIVVLILAVAIAWLNYIYYSKLIEEGLDPSSL